MSREWSTPMVEVPVPEGERKAKAEVKRLREYLQRIVDERSDGSLPGCADAFERRGELARAALLENER
jgi:hypothetical protein